MRLAGIALVACVIASAVAFWPESTEPRTDVVRDSGPAPEAAATPVRAPEPSATLRKRTGTRGDERRSGSRRRNTSTESFEQLSTTAFNAVHLFLDAKREEDRHGEREDGIDERAARAEERRLERAADNARETMREQIRQVERHVFRHPEDGLKYLALLDAQTSEVALAAVMPLRHARDPALVAELAKRIHEDPEPSRRRVAVRGLAGHEDPRALEAVLHAAQSDAAGEVRADGVQIAGIALSDPRRTGERRRILDVITKSFKDPDEETRMQAVLAASTIRLPSDAIAELEKLLQDPSPKVSGMAAHVLRTLR